MLNNRFIKLFILQALMLALVLALAGCAGTPDAGQQADAMQSLLSAREDGVNNKNQQGYLSTVLPSDAVLMKEENNLIRSAGSLDIKDYRLSAGDITEKSDGSVTARLTQSYTLNGQSQRCSFTALFREENGNLYYCGPDFKLKQNSQVKVFYEGSMGTLAQQLLNAETAVLAAMKEQLGFVPNGTISLKLFNDRQVFLQSVKLDLPGWVGGWHEYGEAIKSYTGAFGTEGSAYRPLLNHESTHRMVSELSNDNASYWIQEGLASVFQDALDAPGQGYLSEEETEKEYTPFAEHKLIDLEKIGMEDHGAVSMYYSSSKAYAAFLLDTFGWDKVRQALEYMKKFELIPVTGAEKIAETNARTDEAIKAVFGFGSDIDFQAAFDGWMEQE